MATTAGPARGSEEYVAILERRIAEQRDHIDRLVSLRDVEGDRKARKRIAKLERALGGSALKIEEQKRAIAYLRDRLVELGAEPPRRRADTRDPSAGWTPQEGC